MFLIENMWLTWLLAAILFLVVEACTSGLVSVWFVPGAIAASILSVWVDDLVVQLILFLALSALLMLLCRKYFRKSKAEGLDDTNDKLIGLKTKAESDISADEGRVLLGDVYWRAVSSADISAGEPVVITAVNGNVLTVDRPADKTSA